jgi:hypothetical protein
MKTFFLLFAVVGIFAVFVAQDRIARGQSAWPGLARLMNSGGLTTKIKRSVIEVPAVSIRSARSGARGGASTTTCVLLGSDEPRRFEVAVGQVYPGKGAVADGFFYDIAPQLTPHPEQLRPAEQARTACGDIFIEGTSGLADGQGWKGWLLRTGSKTYHTGPKESRSIPTYRVTAAPPEVPEKPGSWMRRGGKSLIDPNGLR